MNNQSDTDPEKIEQDWVEREFHPYDANRSDTDFENDECLVCGTELDGFYDQYGGGGSEWCTTCDVTVRHID